MPDPNRKMITLTPVNRKRLEQHCAKLRDLEGAKVAPARIINELITKHLEPHPDEALSSPSPEAMRAKRKGVQLARSA